MKILLFSILFLLNSIQFLWSQVPMFPSGSFWKCKSGSSQPINWKDTNFDDSNWNQGPTQMGYGDWDESTILYNGPATGNYPTHYFRKNIIIPDTSLYPGGYMVNIKRDDGIVFYVNGIEIYRNNIISIFPQYTDFAASTCIDDGNAWISFYIPPVVLHNDTNTLAVEIHQAELVGGDLSFDCKMYGINNANPICTRGPFLQSNTENSMVVKWRTQLPSNSQVKIGSTYNVFTDSFVVYNNTYNHEVKLTGLLPSTKYYYTIGTTTNTIVQDTSHYFYTSPPSGTTSEIDIWITGDCGTGYIDQINTANAFSNYIGNKYIDSWMLLGDNAYLFGLDQEYQTNFFDIYQQYRFMGQTCIWPTPGNHDYYSTGDLNDRNTAYFQIFTVTDSAEAGGVISGTESYYSYNIGNAHFISLDSYGTEASLKMYDTTSLQVSWLQQDLAANTLPWTIVYWHHPPYTMGSHNSDTETDLVAIRSKLLVILEKYKVDLVLCGHSHQYERSKLMKGHYGSETSFDSLVHHTSSSSAKYDGSANSCPYYKETSDSINTGIVYVVSGSAGKHTHVQNSWPHNAMYYSNTSNSGSIYLKIKENRLDAKFISDIGIVEDEFTMMKDVNNTYQISAPLLTPINLTASWTGSYYWEGIGDTNKTTTISFDHDSVVIVHDPLQCIADTFYITTYFVGNENYNDPKIKIYPNPTSNNFHITAPGMQQNSQLSIFSISGQLVYEKSNWGNEPKKLVEPGELTPGTYFIRLFIDKKTYYQRIIFN